MGIDDKSFGFMPGCSHLAAKDGGGWPRLLGLQMHALAHMLHSSSGDDGGGGGSDDGGGAAGDAAAAEARTYGMFLERSHGFNPWDSSLGLESSLNAQYMAATSGPFFGISAQATARRRGARIPAQGGGGESIAVAQGIGRLSACVMHSMLWPRAALRRSLAPLLSRIGGNSVVALQMRTGWAEAAASVEAGLDPVVKELTGACPHTTLSPGSSSLLPPALKDDRSRGKGKNKGKGKPNGGDKGIGKAEDKGSARGPLVSPEFAGMAEALAATPEALLRTEVAVVEALEADAVLRGLSTPPGMPRTLAATKEFLLTRHRLSCHRRRCLFREGDNATRRTGEPRLRATQPLI